MNLKEFKGIKELVKLMADSDLSEIAIEQGDEKVTLKRERATTQVITEQVYASAPAPAMMSAPAPVAAPAAGAAPVAEENNPNLHHVTAPLVGTFYAASAPDAAPFVKVGDRVKKGQTLCIIEAMKLMNEIECDADGVVVAVLVENASAVEFGAKIFAIDTSK